MFRTYALSLALVLSVACLPAWAQRGPGGFSGRGPGGGPANPVMLLSNEAVQKELGLSEDQVAKVGELGEAAREKMQAAFGDFAGIRDLPEAEREAKMTELREKMAANLKQMSEEMKPKLAAILSAEQAERLQQIQWQAAGPAALTDETLVKSLGLTAEQQEKLKAIADGAREKITALSGGRGAGGGAEGFAERATKVREISDEAQKAAMEVLTTEQKDQLTKLKGKEFDVAQLRGNFGGGRGGPGGRPAGAGNLPARPE